MRNNPSYIQFAPIDFDALVKSSAPQIPWFAIVLTLGVMGLLAFGVY